MQPGADIKAVFERLCRAVADIEKVAKFAHDDHLGYITSCPTNLGTALRGSVHVRLNHLQRHRSQFEEIARLHNVQIRGTDGEHSASTGGIYDVSNRHRLGKGERTLVSEMYAGLKALMALELEFQSKHTVRKHSSIKGHPWSGAKL
jgi:arginine kinase